MTKITSSASITREAMPDAPEGEWFDNLLEKTNMVDEQVINCLQGGFSISDNTPWKFVTLDLQHGVEVEVKNPFDDQSMPVRQVLVSQANGLTLGADGRPTGSTYVITQPQLSWRPSGKSSNSIILSCLFNAQSDDLSINRLRSNALAISSATPANVCTATSILLPAGGWNIFGAVGFSPAATTTVTDIQAAVATASATLPAADTLASPLNGQIRTRVNTTSGLIITGGEYTLDVPAYKATFSSPTSVFLVAQSTFAVSTMQVYGFLEAHRVSVDPTTKARVTLLFQGA